MAYVPRNPSRPVTHTLYYYRNRRSARELLSKVDGAVKSRFHTGVGVLMMVNVYFTRPTDWGIV